MAEMFSAALLLLKPSKLLIDKRMISCFQ